MRRRHRYTEDQTEWLRTHSYGRPRIETAQEFIELFELDMKPKTVIGFMKRRGIKCGIDMRFRPGRVSHNKGVPITREQYDRLRPTMWKPGSMPQNTDPVGTEKVLSDGYVWIKIDCIPKAKKNVNWRQKHRYIWEQHNGPIPEGSRIVFLDRNKHNFDIDNLACITNGALGVMNSRKLWSKDKEITEAGIAVARLTARSKEIEKHRSK